MMAIPRAAQPSRAEYHRWYRAMLHRDPNATAVTTHPAANATPHPNPVVYGLIIGLQKPNYHDREKYGTSWYERDDNPDNVAFW